jgi:hypothetical protein
MANTAGMEVIVEIDENERCWVGKGFGKGGLLPNDRGCFTTTDGSISWKSLTEPSEDLLLLARGWNYLPEDFATTKKDDPERCWMYASDFRVESVNNAKPNRGVLHWVRFRRLNRVKVFNPDEFVNKEIYEKCDHCDSTATDSLSKQLLDVLSYCTLLHNTTQVTDAIALPLKKSIIDLAIGQERPDEESEGDAFYQLDILRKKLENSVEKERSQTAMSRLISGIEYSFYGRIGRKEFNERCSKVASRCLPKEERDAIAGLIVRKLDPHYQLHCDKVNCGQDCQFARVACPNKGCPTNLSKIYLEPHDNSCPYKIITCDCGDSFPRHERAHHLSQVCTFRDVNCPLFSIGCVKAIKACHMQQHVDEAANAHLLLAVNRMMEYEETMRGMRSKILSLEHESRELRNYVEKYQKTSTKEVSNVEAKVAKTTKALAQLEATCKKQFKKIDK